MINLSIFLTKITGNYIITNSFYKMKNLFYRLILILNRILTLNNNQYFDIEVFKYILIYSILTRISIGKDLSFIIIILLTFEK